MSSITNDRIFQTSASSQSEQNRFLRFPLNSQIDCSIALADLTGVINIELERILPVPQVAEPWLGIINRRGEAIWLLDLTRLLSQKNWSEAKIVPKTAVAMLAVAGRETIGLVVERLSTIECYDLRQLLPISSTILDNRLRACLQGYFLDLKNQPLMVLDIEATVQGILNN